jgi:hypothetical protein
MSPRKSKPPSSSCGDSERSMCLAQQLRHVPRKVSRKCHPGKGGTARSGEDTNAQQHSTTARVRKCRRNGRRKRFERRRSVAGVGTAAPRRKQTAAFRVVCYCIAQWMRVWQTHSCATASMSGDKPRCSTASRKVQIFPPLFQLQRR